MILALIIFLFLIPGPGLPNPTPGRNVPKMVAHDPERKYSDSRFPDNDISLTRSKLVAAMGKPTGICSYQSTRHMSFRNRDCILVYRLEISDSITMWKWSSGRDASSPKGCPRILSLFFLGGLPVLLSSTLLG